jgi:hypothetical protein
MLGRRPHIDAAFAEILATRSDQHLKDWIAAVRSEDLPGLHTFAAGPEKDWDAVVRGLTTHWNSGPVEGRVNVRPRGASVAPQTGPTDRPGPPDIGDRAPLMTLITVVRQAVTPSRSAAGGPREDPLR